MRRLLLTVLSLPLLAQAPELRTTAADRTGLSITIYQNDLAAVRDSRRVALPAGVTRLAFADLAATIRPKSAYLLDIGSGVKVLERNFEFNLLTPTNLMAASLGRAVAQRDPRTGELRWGVQVSLPPSELLMRTPDGFESSGRRDLNYQGLPSGLRASPTLLQTVETDNAGPRTLHLLYTAEGLSWQAHYIATLSSDGKHLDLDAFATVKNQSGVNFTEAIFQLVAGAPNKVEDPPPSEDGKEYGFATVEVAASKLGPPTFREEKLSEYPLFTLDRPVSLSNGQQKQLSLFHAEDIPIVLRAVSQPGYSLFDDENEYLEEMAIPYEPSFGTYLPLPNPWPLDGVSAKTQIFEQFYNQEAANESWKDCHRPPVIVEGLLHNTKANHLGRALPAGGLDLRYRAPEGALIPFSETDLDATPPGEEMVFTLERAHGLVVERRCLSRKRIVKDGHTAWELDMAVTLSNSSSRTLPAILREPFFQDWALLASNLPGHRSGANAFDFQFITKAHSTFTLHYRVRTDIQPLPDDAGRLAAP